MALLDKQSLPTYAVVGCVCVWDVRTKRAKLQFGLFFLVGLQGVIPVHQVECLFETQETPPPHETILWSMDANSKL